MRKTQKKLDLSLGFTMIELLIVIVVIGVLSGLILNVVNSGALRGRTRDAQRASDLKKIQSALELYYADNRVYPVSSSWIKITGADAISTALEAGFINSVPTDPLNTGTSATPCLSTTNYAYFYKTDGSGRVYILTATMEDTKSNDEHTCDSLKNWPTALGCTFVAGVSDVCYGVDNP